MKNRTVYVPVSVEKRLCIMSGNLCVILNDGSINSTYFNSKVKRFLNYHSEITHWLEKVELPTYEEIEGKSFEHQRPEIFTCGSEYIINKLIK